jgi:beta-galactosidase
VVLSKGKNYVRVIAKKDKVVLQDSIKFQYQTEKWGNPAKLTLENVKQESGIVTLQAKLLDANNVQCLDAANWIRFKLAGDGTLIEKQGTSSGSGYVQLYNGRAMISVKTNNGKSVVSATVAGVPTQLINL